MDTINHGDEDVRHVAAALADAAHADGLSDGYHRTADDALGRLATRLAKARPNADWRTDASELHRALDMGEDVPELDRLVAHVEYLEQDSDESAATLKRLTELLTGVANALKGPPPELVLHSWHDLPELAREAADVVRVAQLDGLARAKQRARDIADERSAVPVRWVRPTAGLGAVAEVYDVTELLGLAVHDPADGRVWRGMAQLYPTAEHVSDDHPSRREAVTWVQRQLHDVGVVEDRDAPAYVHEGIEVRRTRINDWRCECGHMGASHREACRGGGCSQCACTRTEEMVNDSAAGRAS